MEDVIQLLPDSIANQIAAGEVVQRPASVVKELMENAVDAGATKITVVVKDAGKAGIQVIDDGAGMTETDARLSLERHATSKIRQTEDLFNIRTMGFRGEALASIAAVSQMEVKTRRPEADIGTLLRVESSEVHSQEPTACSQGTSVSVKNLFFNIPARRNFLKSNGVEMRHVIEDFQRIALANPEVSFYLFQNDLETYNLPASKLSQRIVHLFGKNYQSQLASVDETTSHLTIQGYIGKPEASKRTRGEQFFFVNGRYIRSNYLNHAVATAYEGLITKDQYPFYVLNLQLDPGHIDVNVHPTKTEIKFMDERTVYGIVHSAVRQALGVHNLSPSLDFESNVNFGRTPTGSFDSIAEKNYGQFRTASPEEITKWDRLYEEVLRRQKDMADTGSGNRLDKINFPSAANQLDEKELRSQEDLNPAPGESSFILHSRFIVSQIKSGMIIIDINRAHERILYEKFMHQLEDKGGLSQRLLFPVTIDLNPTDFTLLKEINKEVEQLGFDIEDFGKHSIIINGVPADLESGEDSRLLESLLEQFKLNKQNLSITKNDNLARSLAKRSAIKGVSTNSKVELNAIVDSLFACSNPSYTPDGRMIFFILDLDRIETFFN